MIVEAVKETGLTDIISEKRDDAVVKSSCGKDPIPTTSGSERFFVKKGISDVDFPFSERRTVCFGNVFKRSSRFCFFTESRVVFSAEILPFSNNCSKSPRNRW